MQSRHSGWFAKKLRESMDLQGDIDGLLRDSHPSLFGSVNFKSARPEELQRLVIITANSLFYSSLMTG